MFVSRSREPPSVASTRVLKTHRMNTVENFRLNEKVKTIDFESQHNYCQISDEIDGVRQNLVKIKGVKKNVGVSVERRKLLRDKGLRILPSKQNNADYFTVRTTQGKDVNITCADFYNGDMLRKQLCIDDYQTAGTQLDLIENSGDEEVVDLSLERRRSCIQFDKPKELRFRKITPPLRPGSRRNFKDVDDENSEDDEKLMSFENLSNNERKYGRLRAQTAIMSRDKAVIQRPRSRTWSSIIHDRGIGLGQVPLSRKISRKESAANIISPNRKTSRKESATRNRKTSQESYMSGIQTLDDKSDDKSGYVDQEEHGKQEQCNDTVVLEETIPLKQTVRPTLRPRSVTVASMTSRSSSATDIRRMSLDAPSIKEPIRLPRATNSGKWCEMDTVNSKPRGANVNTAADEQGSDNKGVARTIARSPDRKVSWKDGGVKTSNRSMSTAVRDKQTDRCPPVNRTTRSASLSSVSSQVSDQGLPSNSNSPRPGMARNQTHPSPSERGTPKTNRRRTSKDFAYDARPGKALSKGYMTMQMTIGNKQVKVYVPKFSTDCFDDVVERARAKSAAKASGGSGRSRLSVAEKKS